MNHLPHHSCTKLQKGRRHQSDGVLISYARSKREPGAISAHTHDPGQHTSTSLTPESHGGLRRALRSSVRSGNTATRLHAKTSGCALPLNSGIRKATCTPQHKAACYKCQAPSLLPSGGCKQELYVRATRGRPAAKPQLPSIVPQRTQRSAAAGAHVSHVDDTAVRRSSLRLAASGMASHGSCKSGLGLTADASVSHASLSGISTCKHRPRKRARSTQDRPSGGDKARQKSLKKVCFMCALANAKSSSNVKCACVSYTV
jgi:hypothetical protein